MAARFIEFFKKEFSNNLKVVQLLKGERVGKRRSYRCISRIRILLLWQLWHCCGVTEAQVALIAAFNLSVFLGLVSHLPLHNIP